jgi:23S rRNA (adenine2030-N6)-methyltransferase
VNYRHSYHAGNIADVFKHYVLTLVLRSLRKKDTPFCVIDSHAGSGMYTLKAPGEFQQGIGRLWPLRQDWPALQDLFQVIAKVNPDGILAHYPGSPYIIRDYLRTQDRGVLLELHPDEFADLKRNMAGGGRVAVHHVDAWSGLKAFVPPKENRGLVLIDPPYEKKDEFSRVANALARALKHWRNGVYLVWYPIKGRAPIQAFYSALDALPLEMSAVEFLTLPTDVEQRLNGSGLIIVNAPWGLLESLQTTLPPLATYFAGTEGWPAMNVIPLGAPRAGRPDQ